MWDVQRRAAASLIDRARATAPVATPRPRPTRRPRASGGRRGHSTRPRAGATRAAAQGAGHWSRRSSSAGSGAASGGVASRPRPWSPQTLCSAQLASRRIQTEADGSPGYSTGYSTPRSLRVPRLWWTTIHCGLPDALRLRSLPYLRYGGALKASLTQQRQAPSLGAAVPFPHETCWAWPAAPSQGA